MSAPTAASRPTRPRASALLPVGLLVALALTAWAFAGTDLLKRIRLDQAGAILVDLLEPNWGFLPRTIEPMLETIQIAVISSVLGCAVALPVAFLASRVTNASRLLFWLDRGVLNVIRALPDLFYAMLFVAAVGIGPLPGMMALFFFAIGVVAKLLSETVDGVDLGPVEAAQAAGASGLQATLTAVLPQVLPNYIAYSLYLFEINIRASTVIGIVGGGGIGNVLNTQIKFFNYPNVSVVILELFVLVIAIEQLSMALRRRLV
jgi:phosphonate transport system permease protein